MADVFISYARADAAIARRFAEAFQAQGFSVWWDIALRSGETFDEAIEQALKAAKAVVVLWSTTSVASRWVRTEATIADRKGTLAPVMIDQCDRPILFELTHTADLAHWQGDQKDPAWLSLLTDVRKLTDIRAEPQSTEQASPLAPARARDARPSILVLPFVNMSGDAEQEYFSDGVTEDIITDLNKVSALSVASRNTAFSFKGKTMASAHFKRELGVTHILEGSVRKSGARVRITAQLLDAASDTQIWAERFDRTLNDIFAIQDDISKAIVEALKLKLAPEEKRAIEQRATSSSEAYQLYLMARELTRSSSERLKPAILRICRKAVELDPNFADPWALMALAENELSQRGVEGYSHEQAFASAQRAVALDPNLAEGHAALAETSIRGPLNDWATGVPAMETALRLDPDCYEGRMIAGNIALLRHDFRTAITHFERALTLDADAVRPAGMVVQAYQGVGERENALAASRRAQARCEKILAIEPDHSTALGFFVNALADLGEEDRAREWARRAVLFDPDNARLIYNVGCAMAGLNDADSAVDLIDPLVDKVSAGWIVWMGSDNSLDRVREHPRFVAMMKRAHARFGMDS
ncbi:MAG: TIR domain-containing protein [Hyphomonadaceae bacterium]|nr:TIR domain-containing protein [Hyphomonadaceae bacterium]